MSNDSPQFLLQQLRGLLKSCAFPRLAEDVLSQLQQGHEALQAQLKEMEERKDAAYLERNQVVAALAQCFPSGTAKTAIEGWSEDWHGCVYIDLPTGQASWHYHDSQAHLFQGLPAYEGTWDGHDTPEKYKRLASLPRQQSSTLTDLLPSMCKAFRTTVVIRPQLIRMDFNFPSIEALHAADDEWIAAGRQARAAFDFRPARQIDSETVFPCAVIQPTDPAE